MLEQRLQQQFYDTADALVQAGPLLAVPVARAAEAVLNAVTAGGRVWLWGCGPAQAEAQLAAALWTGHAQQARPALPALPIAPDVLWSAPDGLGLSSPPQALARHLQAVGGAGDVLVMFEDASGLTAWREAVVEAAHAQDMSVVLWAAVKAGHLDPQGLDGLWDTDVVVPVPADRTAHHASLSRAAWCALVDAVDLQLLGELE